MEHLCPVCGFDLPFRPWNGPSASDEICPSCGIQFGNDDFRAATRQFVHEEWRRRWIEGGMRWWSQRPAPGGWDPLAQLQRLNATGDEAMPAATVPAAGSELFSQDPERTVVVIVDTTFGERLWEVAANHPTWIVPSDINRETVEKIWTATRGREGVPTLTMWSNEKHTVTKEDWLSLLDDIELHHGEYSSDPPLVALAVYGAFPAGAARAALQEYEYGTIEATSFGFVAFKGNTA